jgi:hypothetical protein
VTGTLRRLASVLCLALLLAAIALPGEGPLLAVLVVVTLLAELAVRAGTIEPDRAPVLARAAAPRAPRGPPPA